jgi:hypothetical protein
MGFVSGETRSMDVTMRTVDQEPGFHFLVFKRKAFNSGMMCIASAIEVDQLG